MSYPPTLGQAIAAGAGTHDRGFTFIQADGTELFFSWDRLHREAMKRARALRRLGLKRGDRLALVLPDGADFVPTFFGAIWAGVVPVPLYPPLSLGKLDTYLATLVSILDRAEPTVLCAPRKLEQLLWALIGKARSLRQLVSAESLAQEPEGPEPMEVVSPNDPAFLQFTSGSTSTPKGVVVTHASLRANAWSIMADGLKADDSDLGVSWLPLYHDMGLIGFVVAPMFHKTRVVFLPTLSFVRNATLWLETIHQKRGTISFAPNFAYALVAKRAKPQMLQKWDLSCMKAFGCGAEPINPHTLRTFVDLLQPTGLRPEAMLPCYGMAEATLAISFIGLDERLTTDVIDAELYEANGQARPPSQEGRKPLEMVCCGRAFPDHELAVVDGAGRRLPDRQVGEIVFRGPSVMDGYFRDPAATSASMKDGWLHTGDLGYLVDGRVYVTGRKKDLIILNGRNYDPQRMEWLVDELDGVRRGSAVAFSRPGEASEELVVVAEARAQDSAAITSAIRQRLNEQLQVTPADVVLLPPGSLPKTSSGKLQRQKTRAQYLAGTLGREGVRALGATAQRWALAKHLTLAWVGRGRHMARGILRLTVDRVVALPPGAVRRIGRRIFPMDRDNVS